MKFFEPVSLLLRRRTPVEKASERREVKKLVERGILEPPTTPRGTVNGFVPKKDAKLRKPQISGDLML